MSQQQKISKLEEAVSVSPEDLFLITRPSKFNYYVKFKELIEYYKNYADSNSIFPITLEEKFINNNGTSASISNNNIPVGDVESFSFSDYGTITNYTEKSKGITYQELNAAGIIATANKNNGQAGGSQTNVDTNYGLGYFNSLSRIKAFYESNFNGDEVLVGDPVIDKISDFLEDTTWSKFFNLKYTGFKKTEITYTMKKIDQSGSNEGDSRFHIEIFWNGKDKSRVLGVGMVPTGYTNTSTNGAYMNTIIYPDTIAKDDEFVLNQSDADYTNPDIKPDNDVAKLQLKNQYQKAAIKINGENQQILALPMRPWVPKGDVETHTVSINVKSFA